MRPYSDSSLLLLALGLSLAVHAGSAWYWLAEGEVREGRALSEHNELVVRVMRAVPRQLAEPEPEPEWHSVREPVPAVPVAPPVPLRPVRERSPVLPVPPQPPPHAASPTEPLVQAAPLTALPAPVTDRDPARLAEQYHSRLMRHIEAHKFYPTAARRQRLQGGVTVSLQLACDGHVLRQELEEGPLLLRQAARRALELAQPLPAVPAGLSCPQRLQYVMRYELLGR